MSINQRPERESSTQWPDSSKAIDSGSDLDDDEAMWLSERQRQARAILRRAAVAYLVFFLAWAC